MNVTVAILEKAKCLVADPINWTQGASARNSMGYEVDYSSPYARCWCLTGAVGAAEVVLYGAHSFIRHSVLVLLPQFEGSISKWNDSPHRTHDEVLEALDIAIEKAKAS